MESVDVGFKYRDWVRHHYNFLTPEVVRYVVRGGCVVELSRGDWLGRPLYGVTLLLRRVPGGFESVSDFSRCFEDFGEAEVYFNQLVESLL